MEFILNPENCKYFKICYYNLCPLDPNLKFRTYHPDDPYKFCRLIKNNEINQYLNNSKIKKYKQIIKSKIKDFEKTTLLTH